MTWLLPLMSQQGRAACARGDATAHGGHCTEEASLIQRYADNNAVEADSWKFDMKITFPAGTTIADNRFIYEGNMHENHGGGSGCGTNNYKCNCTSSGSEFLMKGQGTSWSVTGLIFSCSFKILFPDKSCTCRYHIHIPYSGDSRLERDEAGCACFTTSPAASIPAFGHDFTLDLKATEVKHIPQDKDVTLRLMNYNVFGRWLNFAGLEGQVERLGHIPIAIGNNKKLSKADVIVVDEQWCPDPTATWVKCGDDKSGDLLKEGLNGLGFAHHSKLAFKPGAFNKVMSGGAMVYSKFPILATSMYVYKSGTGSDRQAAKAAVYIRINKTETNGAFQVLNIIGSHLQAWSNEKAQKARVGQLSELRANYIPNLGIPTDGTEPILFSGDLNIDDVNYPDEARDMEQTLNFESPEMVGEQLFSSDPSTNFLVGKDGSAKDNGCLEQYKRALDGGKPSSSMRSKCSKRQENKLTALGKPWLPRYQGAFTTDDCQGYCSCCQFENLEYSLFAGSDKYLQPKSAKIEIVPLKSDHDLIYSWGWCEGQSCVINKEEVPHKMHGRDLSDHYPTLATFVFKPVTSSFPVLDGCKNDEDCTQDGILPQCRCTGEDCTIAGKRASAKDIDAPVNKNCIYAFASVRRSCWCRPGGHLDHP